MFDKMFERMSDEMFWKSGGDLEQQLHPARLPPFARASVSRLCPNHDNKPSAITITIKPPVHTEIQILSTITEIQILSNIKENTNTNIKRGGRTEGSFASTSSMFASFQTLYMQ